MDSQKSEEFYEQKYRTEGEPWGYTKFAIEVLRHEFVINTAKALKPNFTRALDVGCGKGHLTFRLNGIAAEVVGIDVSKTAVEQATLFAESLSSEKNGTKFQFMSKNILTVDFPDNHFDLILLCDGIEEWFGSDEEKMAALKNANKFLKSGGYAILSDYQKPQHFESFINFINKSPLKVQESFPLNDRLCYQFYSWLKMGANVKIVKRLFASRSVANVLVKVSSWLGKNSSKHICVVAQKTN